MRKWWVIIMLLVATCLSAENVEHENVLSVRYGGIWMQDQYLSPLLYSGQQLGMSNEWWQAFRCDSTKRWENIGKMDIGLGQMYNQMYTNLIYSLGLHGGWGACYKWYFTDYGLSLKLGPY